MTELSQSHPLAAAFADLSDMTVLLNNGWVLPITNLLDEDGDECDPEEAVFAVAGDDRGWWTVPLQFPRPDGLN